MAGQTCTYTWTNFATIAPAGSILNNIYIRSVQRIIVVKRITITWELLNAVTGALIPWDGNTTQRMYFTLGIYQTIAAKKFDNTPATGLDGSVIYLFVPGEYNFNNMKFQNEVALSIGMTNNAATNTSHIYSLIIDTEENILR